MSDPNRTIAFQGELGANSHMAIRAAEFELPAALGIGETRYRALANSFELELDPANKVIRTLS